ncbi:MAG: hypothetical protein L0241_14715 [Planctomycetia bacterium]|nr:hypothetical protein [Planctomycetia bacterium]
MKLSARVRKLEASVPKCDPQVRYLAGPDHVPSEADRCKRCGGCHILVIEEEIVEARSVEESPS